MHPPAHALKVRSLNLPLDVSLPRVGHARPSTKFERLLLVMLAALFPLEDHLPPIAGYSVMYLLFLTLAGYLLLNRFRSLFQTWLHPVFLAAYVFLGVSCIMEYLHDDASFAVIYANGLMFSGAVLVSAICRDRRALRAAVFGHLIAGLWISILLITTSYGAVSGGSAADFVEASYVRGTVAGNMPIVSNLNGLARFAAQGAVVALALGLFARTSLRRAAWLGVALFCSVAAFLTMSRTGVAIIGISAAAVLFSYGIRPRTVTIALIGLVGILVWVPDAVFSRLSFSMDAPEARAEVYNAAIHHFDDYYLAGVGAGNFWGEWGVKSDFARVGVQTDHVVAAHNGFIQVTIYWGVLSLLALVAVVWFAFRCLPKRSGIDPVSLCLIGIAASALLASMAASDINSKMFSMVLGMLVGSQRWVWTRGVVEGKRS